ncbi:MAG TPA: helix-turn-helix domain-containing protein [Solirubrobacteraceae bacterium]|jgi:AcrR family transcriptional regulator|nr:helix-turn-helix domain-containing protein [Solirubrobacteraceae bacterium]
MRELLIERDFDGLSTEEILQRAGVSRGAMYHHFPGKVDLFRAAWQESERENITRIASAAAELDPQAGPFDQLIAGCRAYLREAGVPGELQRIGLRQSRSVLGWEGWRDGAADLGIAVMRGGIQAAVDAHELRSADVETTTHLLLSALIEAALLISTDPRPETALSKVEPELVRLLESLHTD